MWADSLDQPTWDREEPIVGGFENAILSHSKAILTRVAG